MFDKFHRGIGQRRAVPGFGLGLSMCRGIVEAHHGTIVAANRDGGGGRVSPSVFRSKERRRSAEAADAARPRGGSP